MPHHNVAQAIAKVRASGAYVSTRLSLEFTILTAARSGEVRLATWTEVDMDAAVWIVPASRMKAKREHRVPLADRAIEILREAAELADCQVRLVDWSQDHDGGTVARPAAGGPLQKPEQESAPDDEERAQHEVDHHHSARQSEPVQQEQRGCREQRPE